MNGVAIYIKQLTEDADDTYVTAPATGEDEQLPNDQKLLVINYYIQRIAMYAFLLKEYEKQKAKEKETHAASEFPCFNNSSQKDNRSVL